MQAFVAELVGTMILVILGDGVVANVVLRRTKGNQGGWIVITTGWGLAVALAVYCVGRISGAHLNPAVSIGLAVDRPVRVVAGRALHRGADDRRHPRRDRGLARLPAALRRHRRAGRQARGVLRPAPRSARWAPTS